MERRDFLKLSAGAFMASQLPWPARAGNASPLASPQEGRTASEVKRDVNRLKPLNLKKIEIPVGIEKPFGAIHISDTHLTLADNRNDERKISLAAGRARGMNLGEHYLDECIHYARRHDLLMLHTGDLIDFVSEANLDRAAQHYMQADWFVSSGNHEFSQYVGEAREDEAYKQQSYQKVQDAYPNDLTFCSRVVNGVNLIALDDVYYNVTERQHELLEQEVKRGLPIVILCHVPFYTPDLCKFSLERTPQCAYVTGAPLEITRNFEHRDDRPQEEQWRNRSVQQQADKPTLEFLKWLRHQKAVKGLLTGHMHFFYEGPFSKTAMQYVVGATYQGDAYEVRFV